MASIEHQKEALEELIAESGGLERMSSDDREYVHKMRAEIRRAEKVQKLAQDQIDEARALGRQAVGSVGINYAASEQDDHRVYKMASVCYEDIGWIDDDRESLVEGELIKPEEGPEYIFVDLTGQHRSTSDAVQRLQEQSSGEGTVYDQLMGQLIQHTIPLLDQKLKQRSNLRPVNGGVGYGKRPPKNGKDRCVATNYPAYKEGVMGTHNRAIILCLGRATDSDIPVYGLATLYDHDDEGMIHRALNH